MTPTVITNAVKPIKNLTKIQIPLKTISLILILTFLTLMILGYTLIAVLIIVPLKNMIQGILNGRDMFFRLANVRKDGKHVFIPRIFYQPHNQGE